MTNQDALEICEKYALQDLYSAQPYSEFNPMLKDVDEKMVKNLGCDVKHLSEGCIPTPAWPVNGIIIGPSMRLMVPLVFREYSKPTSKVLNVWCVLDTTSVYTCLSVRTMEAFLGEGNVKKSWYLMQIQDAICNIQCHVSKVGSDFEHANILGLDALRSLRVSANFNISEGTVRIVKYE